MKIDRSLQPHYGPRFFRFDDRDMFEHRIDASSVIGPRVATRTDKENHPKLWSEYQAALTVELNAGLGSETTAKKKGK